LPAPLTSDRLRATAADISVAFQAKSISQKMSYPRANVDYGLPRLYWRSPGFARIVWESVRRVLVASESIPMVPAFLGHVTRRSTEHRNARAVRLERLGKISPLVQLLLVPAGCWFLRASVANWRGILLFLLWALFSNAPPNKSRRGPLSRSFIFYHEGPRGTTTRGARKDRAIYIPWRVE
jgi:hypothetical protein